LKTKGSGGLPSDLKGQKRYNKIRLNNSSCSSLR
jgi:hypothetical protein